MASTIDRGVQKHQELISEGKGTPVRPMPEPSPNLPAPSGIGQLGPSRGSFVPGQVLDTDIAKQNIIGTPERSRMFPIPSNNGNNNAGIQQALKSIVKASEASVAQTVASFKNTPVATTDPSTGLLTQTTIGQSTPLPFAPPERRIPLDNVGDGLNFVRLATTHASNNVAFNFKGAWSSATNYVIGDEVTDNNIYWIALAANTNSEPSITNVNWQAVGRIQGDLQIFTASGTWSKPAAGTFAIITVIGGGGGGGKGNLGSGVQGGGGGGGGGISTLTLPLDVLGATESVTVGTGGSGQAAGSATAGGASIFGSWLKANGGGPGSTAGAGSGGTGNFGNGGNGGSGTSPTNGFQGTGMAAGGGGSGANEGTTLSGGNGGAGAPFTGTALTGGAGGASSTTGNASPGASGTAPATNQNVGGPGAGGGGDTTHTGSSGGQGGTPTATCYGGGGGGGGSAPASSTVGTGGGGASVLVVVAVY